MSLKSFFLGDPCVQCGNRTHNKFEGKTMCGTCELNLKMVREGARRCPKCDLPMKKKVLYETIIIDKCFKCQGVWLDAGELKKIREKAEEEGQASGRSSGVATGICVGMAIN